MPDANLHAQLPGLFLYVKMVVAHLRDGCRKHLEAVDPTHAQANASEKPRALGTSDLPVQHVAQDLGGHHDAHCIGVDGDVSRHQANIRELLLQLAVLLVAQSLHQQHTSCLGRGQCRLH